MQLYFIRHAQSANNALWERTGSSQGRSEDPGLTEIGHRQTAILADFLCSGSPKGGYNLDHQNPNGFGITHVYSSLMLRAVQTGAAIAARLGLPLVAWQEIHEEGGIYLDDPETGEPLGLPGRSRAYFQANFPNLILPEGLDEKGWWNRPFELHEARPARAQHFLDELLGRHGDSADLVAVISHGGFYNLFLTRLLGVADREKVWFTINNAAITRIDFVDGQFDLVYLNRTDFLPAELVT